MALNGYGLALLLILLSAVVCFDAQLMLSSTFNAYFLIGTPLRLSMFQTLEAQTCPGEQTSKAVIVTFHRNNMTYTP